MGSHSLMETMLEFWYFFRDSGTNPMYFDAGLLLLQKSMTPIKIEGCPRPSTLGPASRTPQGEGPHHLLFLPLFLRKYFLNSLLRFVYLYSLNFLP